MSNRVDSVDICRFLAILAVIAIHTFPASVEPGGLQNVQNTFIIINQSARFAVPFFFVISGYFWGIKINKGTPPYSATTTSIKRIATVLLFWSCVYILPYDLFSFFEIGFIALLKSCYWHLLSLLKHPIRTLFQGTKAYLWYLMSLVISMALSAAFVRFNKTSALLLVSAALYIFGVFTFAYARPPFGIQIVFATGFGPFVAPLLFTTGHILSRKTPDTNWASRGLGLMLTGYILHFSEIFFIHTHISASLEVSFVFGTYFMGVGFALIALSGHPLLKSQSLSKTGRMTLGIYTAHFIFVDTLNHLGDGHTSLFFTFVRYIAVVLTTYFLVLAMTKSLFFRKFVS